MSRLSSPLLLATIILILGMWMIWDLVLFTEGDHYLLQYRIPRPVSLLIASTLILLSSTLYNLIGDESLHVKLYTGGVSSILVSLFIVVDELLRRGYLFKLSDLFYPATVISHEQLCILSLAVGVALILVSLKVED